MKILIEKAIRDRIHHHLQAAYPEEGAGFLLGDVSMPERTISAMLPIENAREDAARHNRFLITPQDMLRAELEAEKLGLDILGVFHSHPDCPNVPSEFDREWALPWYSYTISRVDQGEAVSIRSWRLNEDRKAFTEEDVEIVERVDESANQQD